MYIRFFDNGRNPTRSFFILSLQDISFKDYAVKIIDKNGIAHQVQNKDFSFFIVIQNK